MEMYILCHKILIQCIIFGNAIFIIDFYESLYITPKLHDIGNCIMIGTTILHMSDI